MPFPFVAAAAVGGSLLNYFQGRSNTNKTIAANREAAELEWQRSRQAWSESNAYNAPEAQMERLRQAGLNPNLVYGQGGATGNVVSAQQPKYNAPNYQYNYPAPV